MRKGINATKLSILDQAAMTQGRMTQNPKRIPTRRIGKVRPQTMSLAVMWLRNWSGTTYHVDISVLQAWFWKPTTSAATAMRRESILRCTCFLVKCQRFTDQINDMYVLELYLFIILKLYFFMILNLYLFLYENISEIIKSLVTLCTNIMIHVAGAKIIRDIKNSQNAKQRKNSGLV